MKSMKWAALLFLFIFSCYNVAFAGTSKDLQSFAETEGLSTFKKIVSADPVGFGYSGIEEIEKVKLGESFQINYIDPEKLMHADSKNSRIKSIIKPTDQWEYIILSDGIPKSFLTIGKENDKYKVISAGGSAVDFGIAYKNVLNQKAKGLTLIIDKGIRMILAEKDSSEVIIAGISPEKSKLLNGLDNSKVSTSTEFISSLKKTQLDPNQQNDSGGLVSQTTEGNPGFPWVRTVISIIVAFTAVVIISIRYKKGTTK